MSQRLLALALLLVLAPVAPAAEVPEDLVFLDVERGEHTRRSPHGHLLVWFNSRCPNARKTIQTTVNEFHQTMVERQAPLDVIFIGTDVTGEELEAYAEKVELEQPILAHDPRNRYELTLSNSLKLDFVRGPDGPLREVHPLELEELAVAALLPEAHGELGAYAFEPYGIDDPKIRKVWWMLEQGNTKAVKPLVQARRRAREDDPTDEQIILLHDEVQRVLLGRVEELLEAEPSFATYEALEAAVEDAEHFDPDEGEDRLREWRRQGDIREELKARAAWYRCQDLLNSESEKQQRKGELGLQQLAEQMPDTVYGRRAAQTRE